MNPELPTGEVEVGAATVVVLNRAEPPPFPLSERADDVDEVLRLRHRYLDLRRPSMQHNLRLRSTVNAALRTSMTAQGFVEVETPMLIASTPEGARDFVVPSRLSPGDFYALPQSPQLFKQLLMVGGLDRYFQIARCLRDEDLRGNRQFEFMQYDMEMSFAGQADVQEVVTEAVSAAVEAVTGAPLAEVPTMTWAEAMERFGSDKPDIRFGMELTDLADAVAGTEFKAFHADAVKGICVPGHGDASRSTLDGLVDRAKQLGAAGLVWMRVRDGGTLESPVAKFLSDAEQSAIVGALGAAPGDLVLIVAGAAAATNTVLGALRLDLGRPPVTEGGLVPLWVVDFPLFEAHRRGRPADPGPPSVHPAASRRPRAGSTPPAMRSSTCGRRPTTWCSTAGSSAPAASGSTSPRCSSGSSGCIGMDEVEAQARFGFLLDAFRYGAPPHAGFAFGIDRLVAVLAGEESIREVIAFPKTQSGADPLTGAPGPIDALQLRELGLAIAPKPT